MSWGWLGSPGYLLLAYLWDVGPRGWGCCGDGLTPRAGALSLFLSWRPELAGAPCLPQLAFGPDRLCGEESWSGGAHVVCVFPVSMVCLKIQDLCMEKAVHSSYRGFLNSSCSGIHLGRVFAYQQLIHLRHLVFPSCGFGWSWFCCPLSSHSCPWGSVLNSRVSRG